MRNSALLSGNNDQIFKGGVHDIPAIRDIAVKTWPSAYRDVISEGQIRYMLELMYSPDSLLKQMNEGHSFFLLKAGETPAGFASVGLTDDRIFKLHKLYVLPELQGKGIGKKLLQAAISKATKEGGSRMILQVNKKNPALVFYFSQGFEIEREAVFPIGQGYIMDDYIMSKTLDSQAPDHGGG